MVGARPKEVDQLLGEGQQSIGKALLQSVEDGDIPNAVLFKGPSGVGKTTLALMFASALLGEDAENHPAVTHVDCADKSGVDFVRDQVLPSLDYGPLTGKYRIWFLDEVHGLSPQARHALLVRLEKLPPHVVILAATTEAGKLEQMFHSRFNTYELVPPDEREIKRYILDALADHGVVLEGAEGAEQAQQVLPKHAARDLYERSAGNIRLLNTYLRQVLDGSYQLSGDREAEEEGNLAFEIIYRGIGSEKAFSIARSVVDYEGEAAAMVNMAIKALEKGKGGNARKRACAVLRHFGGGLPVQTNSYGNQHTRSAFFRQLLLVVDDVA